MYKGERFNAVTHLVGAVLAVAGLPVLLLSSGSEMDVWKLTSFSVYGAFLILLYVSSTLYHSTRGRVKSFFRRVDHLSIYLLIAGSYTPFALVTLRASGGWMVFGVVWALAVIGIIQELWIGKKTRLFSMMLYLAMGWLAILVIRRLYAALMPEGFYLLLSGGLSYTVGVIFYLNDERWKHAHGVWHLFVLVGSVTQYATILFFVR